MKEKHVLSDLKLYSKSLGYKFLEENKYQRPTYVY